MNENKSFSRVVLLRALAALALTISVGITSASATDALPPAQNQKDSSQPLTKACLAGGLAAGVVDVGLALIGYPLFPLTHAIVAACLTSVVGEAIKQGLDEAPSQTATFVPASSR